MSTYLRVSLTLLTCAVCAGPLLAGAEPWTMGAGASWFDCDNDGDLDLLFLRGEGEAFLHENRGDHFVDITAAAIPPDIFDGTDKQSLAIATACADFDNDGWVDILIGTLGYNILLMNNADGTFSDQSSQARIRGLESEFTSAVAPIDFDNDGWLDVFVANYRGRPCYMYRNKGLNQQGQLVFSEVGDDIGVRWGSDDDAGSATLGVTVADYNNDGYPDIYLGNDFETVAPAPGGGFDITPGPNILYKNNGNGTFTDVSTSSGANDAGDAMGVTFADYNNDGWMDIFVANFWEDALLENNQDGTFTNVTEEVEIIRGTPEEWHYNGWGTSLFDFDNDGDLDLHVANGYIGNALGQILYEPDQLFLNRGENQNFTFQDISEQAGITQTGDSRGACYGDFNQDGFLDILVINTGFENEPNVDPGPERLLYQNMKNGTFKDVAYELGFRSTHAGVSTPEGWDDFSANKWIQVRAIGGYSEEYTSGASRTPFGTRITVTAGGKTWIQDMGSSSYASQNSPYLHFGLGEVETITEVRVRFPNGVQQVFDGNDVEPNSILTVHELEGITEVVPVELLGFNVSRQEDGVKLEWTYSDDGDLAFFFVEREAQGSVAVLATEIPGFEGRASFADVHPVAGHEAVYTLGAVLRTGEAARLASRTYRHEVLGLVRLRAPRPNPFLEGTGIPVLAPRGGRITIDILDVAGRLVRQLDPLVPTGETLVAWDGRDQRGGAAPAGVYYARIRGSRAAATKLVKTP